MRMEGFNIRLDVSRGNLTFLLIQSNMKCIAKQGGNSVSVARSLVQSSGFFLRGGDFYASLGINTTRYIKTLRESFVSGVSAFFFRCI